MTKINIIHVDDQQETINSFQQLMSTRDDINYIRSFTKAIDACHFLLQNKGAVDIAFLDVEMGVQNGLWLAEQLKTLPVNIIFLTSHTEYVMQAFEVCAIDYILKPATMQRLDEVLLRYQTRQLKNYEMQQQQMSELYNTFLQTKTPPKRIFLSTVGEIIVVQVDEIMYLEANDNYTMIHLKEGAKHLSTKRISIYEETLSLHLDFVRIHRSYIVNKNYVKSILRDGRKQRFAAIMTNAQELEISFKKREEIIASLES